MTRRIQAAVSHHRREVEELRADRELACEYLKLAMESLDDPEDRAAGLLALRAIAEASRITNAIVLDYTAAPLYFSADGNGSHEWIVEFERPPDSLERFTEELDRSLQQLNTDYEAKRHKSIALRMPAVHQARTGLFADWLKRRGKLGGQHKVPRLSNERTLIEELLSMNKA
jgi:hypothetical protein